MIQSSAKVSDAPVKEALSEEELDSLVLIDYGSARTISPETGRYRGPSRGGRWDFMPKEQFGPESYGRGDVTLSFSSDVFSLASIAVFLLSGSAPFGMPKGGDKLNLSVTKDHPRRSPLEMKKYLDSLIPHGEESFKTMLLSCLDENLEKRLSLEAFEQIK
jgi:serine/threonine protein kinase